jgi:hypothetical protein
MSFAMRLRSSRTSLLSHPLELLLVHLVRQEVADEENERTTPLSNWKKEMSLPPLCTPEERVDKTMAVHAVQLYNDLLLEFGFTTLYSLRFVKSQKRSL